MTCLYGKPGSIRDPSITAAIMGLFRERTPDMLLADPDREGWVTKVIDQSDKWLNDPEGTWKDGLDLSETAANLLEAGELVAMRIPPTMEIEMLRQGEVNMRL